MNDFQSIFKRCLDERITILTRRSSRADRSQLNSSMLMSRVKTKDYHYSFNESNSLHKYDVELAYQSELEYTPKFILKPKKEIMSDYSECYELPKIQFIEQQPLKKYSIANSQHDSSGLTTRKNTLNKFRSFSNRFKAMRVGYCSIDPDSPYTLEIFKLLCNSNVYQEITKPQLVKYLTKQMGYQASVQKLINYLQLPYSITLAVFKQLLLQIREMSQQEINFLVFNSYDTISKTYLNTRDLFELFKCGGAAQKDADIIYKYLRMQAIRKPFEIEQQPCVQPKKRVKNKQKKQVVITMLKEQSRRLSEIYNSKHDFDKNVVTENIFQEIYSDSIPQFFKTFVQLLANYNCD